MKKKLLLSVILFISLFVSVFSFTEKTSAVELGDLGLNETKQKEILKAYDLDHNGKLQSRDVTKMKQQNYSKEEIDLVQKCIVHNVKFTWCNVTIDKLRYLDSYISMGELLYIDYFPNNTGKIIAHINIKGRFVRVSYDYNKYGGRY